MDSITQLDRLCYLSVEKRAVTIGYDHQTRSLTASFSKR